MATSGLDTLLQTLREVVHRSINDFLWNYIPCLHQTLLQRIDRLMGFRACFRRRLLRFRCILPLIEHLMGGLRKLEPRIKIWECYFYTLYN
uniref:Uncharacterized protein n=1 Tax=Acrobeloides nanus TaxID=290746 RepID=A0A914EBY7_9BILA